MHRQQLSSCLDLANKICEVKNTCNQKLLLLKSYLKSYLACAKVNPSEKAITALCAMTAKKRLINSPMSFWRPMARPSKIEWKDNAMQSNNDLLKKEKLQLVISQNKLHRRRNIFFYNLVGVPNWKLGNISNESNS